MKTAFPSIALTLSAQFFFAAALSGAAAITTGVIQGVVKDDGGLTLSTVHVLAVDSSLGGKSYTAVTSTTGSFSLSGVAPGNYSICVQEPGGFHLDPCVWATPVQVKVTAGLTLTSTPTATKGTLLQVRVNDPSGLWKTGSGNPEILFGVMLPSKLFQPLRAVSVDAAGRNFDLTIPAGKAVKLTWFAPHFTVTDSNGSPLSSVLAPVQAPAAALTNLLLTYTITGKK